MSGQAETSAPESGGTLSDLASYLADTPEAAPDEQDDEQTTDESTDDAVDTDEPENDGQDESEESGDEPDDEDEPATVEAKPITFKVKGADGTEETVEIKPEDIPGAFLRQRDYTAKTTALAQRESEAVQFLTSKHEEIRANYLTQAEVARAAVAQIAGIRSEEEMAQLASTDPAAWVQEQQRQRQLSAYLNQLDQQINGEKQRAAQEREQRQQQSLQSMYQKTWQELEKDGIDKPRLSKIYETVSKDYGFSSQELGNVYDHRLVKLMKDATAYRELQAKRPEVTKKVQAAPRLPQQNSQQPNRLDKALENKFKTGRAKLNDLAAYLR